MQRAIKSPRLAAWLLILALLMTLSVALTQGAMSLSVWQVYGAPGWLAAGNYRAILRSGVI